jgi:hypothetical protein
MICFLPASTAVDFKLNQKINLSSFRRRYDSDKGVQVNFYAICQQRPLFPACKELFIDIHTPPSYTCTILKRILSKPFIKAAAKARLDGLKKIVFQAVIKFNGKKIEVFDTREQAKDWLVTQ